MNKIVEYIPRAMSKGIKVAGKVNPLDSINNISSHVLEWKQIKETEQTKREEIKAKRDVLIANIQAERDAFIENLRENYKERTYVYQNLFERLDSALESGQVEVAQLALSGIVEQIKTNPMPSFGEFRQALNAGSAIDF